jgi:hypothetical protein
VFYFILFRYRKAWRVIKREIIKSKQAQKSSYSNWNVNPTVIGVKGPELVCINMTNWFDLVFVDPLLNSV